MVTRTLATLFGASVMVVAVITGRVDLAATADLLTARRVNVVTAFALVTVVCWVGVATVAGAVLAMLLGRRRTRVRPRLAALVASALVVLGLGVAHRSTAVYRVCCVGQDTASVAEQHVR